MVMQGSVVGYMLAANYRTMKIWNSGASVQYKAAQSLNANSITV